MWVRDASFTVDALLGLKLQAEAHAALAFLLRCIGSTGLELKIFYRLDGRLDSTEQRLIAPATAAAARSARVTRPPTGLSWARSATCSTRSAGTWTPGTCWTRVPAACSPTAAATTGRAPTPASGSRPRTGSTPSPRWAAGRRWTGRSGCTRRARSRATMPIAGATNATGRELAGGPLIHGHTGSRPRDTRPPGRGGRAAGRDGRPGQRPRHHERGGQREGSGRAGQRAAALSHLALINAAPQIDA